MKEKKAHGVQLLIRAIVRDADGKVISDTGKKVARSYVIQFIEFIYFMGLGVYNTATDVSGAETYLHVGIVSSVTNFEIKALINDDAHGIVIGTGDTAVTNADHKLETQLTEGITAGKITHGAQVVGSAAVVGANVDMDLTRAFSNNTGSLITVKEAGLYCLNQSQTNRKHMLMRDVLAGGVEVADKCSLTIIYTMRTTV